MGGYTPLRGALENRSFQHVDTSMMTRNKTVVAMINNQKKKKTRRTERRNRGRKRTMNRNKKKQHANTEAEDEENQNRRRKTKRRNKRNKWSTIEHPLIGKHRLITGKSGLLCLRQ